MQDRPLLTDLDSLPFAVEIYKRDLDITRYNVPFLHHPFVAFYTSRGCPAFCTYCLWPQTFGGHKWRTRSSRNVVAELERAFELFPNAKEIFFDDDTFAWGKARTLELCRHMKPLKFTWSCTCRVHADFEMLKAMKEAGCRLLIVGFESGDPTILKNIKKGATVKQALTFMSHCRQLGISVHGDFIIGLPGETRETIMRTIRFAEELDCETIQVSIAHPYPGTAFDAYVRSNGYLTDDDMADELGHQLPNLQYPGLTRQEIVEAVEYFYGRYYFPPEDRFQNPAAGAVGSRRTHPPLSRGQGVSPIARQKASASQGQNRVKQAGKRCDCSDVRDPMDQVKVIINGDDFGKSPEVNEAVIRAFKAGTLTSCSLMVTGEAFDDAVRLARANEGLAVGLHLVTVQGRAVLPPSEIPLLVDRAGHFPDSPTLAGLKYYFSRSAREAARSRSLPRNSKDFMPPDLSCPMWTAISTCTSIR